MTDTGFTKTAPVNGYVSPYPVDPMPDWVAALRDSAAPVWLFAYGSLMWNPAFHHTETVQGRVHGWSRKFCLWLHMARGSPDAPGLMLALDRGGACHGMAFRIAAAHRRASSLTPATMSASGLLDALPALQSAQAATRFSGVGVPPSASGTT